MIGKVSHIPILGVCVGAVMTLVVQSSSATIAVLQNFAAQAESDGVTSIIGLTGAIPILLGRQYRYNDHRSAGFHRTAKRCQKDGVCPLCI